MSENVELAQTLEKYITCSMESSARQSYLSKARRFWAEYRAGTTVPDFELEDEPDTERPISRINLLHKTVETCVSVYLKNLPIVQLKPFKPNDYDLIHEQNKHLVYGLGTAGFIPRCREALRESSLTGMAIYHIGWDASDQRVYDNGEAFLQVVPREDVFLDPLPGLTTIQDSRFVILRFWLPIESALSFFGDPAAEALQISPRRGRPRDAGGGEARFLNFTWDEVSSSITGSQDLGGTQAASGKIDQLRMEDWFDPNGKLIACYECWYKPSQRVLLQRLADGGTRYRQESPLGRVAWMINGHIVKGPVDNPNRKWKNAPWVIDEEPRTPRRIPIGNGEFPVIRQVAYQMVDRAGRPGLYEVQGIIEQIESTQYDVNDLYRQVVKNAKLLGNPPIVEMQGRVKSPSGGYGLTPGEVITVDNEGTVSEAIQVLPIPSIPAHVTIALQMGIRNISDVSGVKDFVAGDVAGQMGTSHTTEGATELISTASFAMMWTLLQNLELSMEQIAKQVAGLQQLYYKSNRFTNVDINGETHFTEWTSRNTMAEFEYKVVSGTSTPLQEIERLRYLTWADQLVEKARAEGSVRSLRHAVLLMESANVPYIFPLIEELRDEIGELEQQQMLMEQSQILLGATQPMMGIPQGGMQGGMQGQQPVPEGLNRGGAGGLEALAAQLGVAPEMLARAMAA